MRRYYFKHKRLKKSLEYLFDHKTAHVSDLVLKSDILQENFATLSPISHTFSIFKVY